nr:GNAT family N-acetyltransferase [Alicyclobacillus fructus]
MCRTLDHSLNFGLYTRTGSQIGFARVITDYGQFAYLCDVFVLAPYRGRGLGRALVKAVMDHPDLVGLRRYALDAVDEARSLYAQFGFAPLADPSGHMEITHRAMELWPRGNNDHTE